MQFPHTLHKCLLSCAQALVADVQLLLLAPPPGADAAAALTRHLLRGLTSEVQNLSAFV